MKKYLVVFITEKEFACKVVSANNIHEALNEFYKTGLNYEDIYSVSLVK